MITQKLIMLKNRVFIYLFLFFIVLFCITLPPFVGNLNSEETTEVNKGGNAFREKAVLNARNGNFENAITLIKEALEKTNNSPEVVSDYVVILAWTGKYREAINAYEGLPKEYMPPNYILPEVAKCYRSIKEYDKAISLYKKYIDTKEKDKNKEATKGLIYTYLDSNQLQTAHQYIEERMAKEPQSKEWLELDFADILLKENKTNDAETIYLNAFEKDPLNVQAGIGISRISIAKKNYEKAEDIVGKLLNKEPNNIDVLFLKGELLEAKSEYISAYEIYEKISKVYPNNQTARNLKYRALMNMDANGLAMQKLEESGDVIDTDIREMLWGNEAVVRIWWLEPDTAFKILDRNIDYAEKVHSEKFLLRSHYDKIIALQQIEKMEGVIQEYENLKKMKLEPLPPWVISNTASAELYLRHPKDALSLYEDALKKQWDPLFGETRRSIYSTLVELGRYKEAGDILAKLDKEMPNQVVYRGILQDNWWKEDVAISYGWWYLYQDRLSEGQKYLENLVYRAPWDTHIRTALAQTYLWRGWERRALEEFEITRTMDVPSKNVTADIGYCYALNENDYGIEARKLAKELLKQYPTNLHVQRLNRDFEVQDMRTLTFDTVVTNEKPGAKQTYWFTKLEQPIYPWRKIFGMYTWRDTSQNDLKENIRRTSVGMDWRINRDWWFVGTLSAGEKDNKEFGYSGEVTFNPTDYLSFNAMYDSNSLDVPLKAEPFGIKAKESRFVARYVQSESFSSELRTNLYKFSDGNESLSYAINMDKALTTTAYWKTRLGLNVYTSTNSKTDVPYYSPEHFSSVYAVPMVEHVWYRVYEKALVDRLYLGLGMQKEEGFSERGVWYVQYEQDYKISDTLNLLIGATFSKKNYSGDYTDVGNFYLTIKKSF